MCADSEVEFGQEEFQIADGRMITCKSIGAVDDDVSDGTQTSRLITATRGTDIPVEVHPESIPITIIDNDSELIIRASVIIKIQCYPP